LFLCFFGLSHAVCFTTLDASVKKVGLLISLVAVLCKTITG
jgi:hypothetical protein